MGLSFCTWHRFLTETGRNPPGDCDLFFVSRPVYWSQTKDPDQPTKGMTKPFCLRSTPKRLEFPGMPSHGMKEGNIH